MTDGSKPGRDSHFFLAINIAAFTPLERFRRDIDRISRQIQSSRRAAGVERLYAPGQLEAETEQRYRQEGIPLNDETLGRLAAVAKELGVASALS